jgi:hypothetical protein
MTTMQATTSPHAASPERESVLGVVGITLGVLLIVSSIGALVMLGRSSPPLDGEALLRERFARAGPFPFGLEIVGAERELDGREVVRLEGSRGAAADLAIGPASADGGDARVAGSVPARRIDWDALPVVAGGDPARAALVWFPRKSAERVLREQFTALRFDSGGMGPGGGGGSGKPGDPPEAPDPKLQDGGTITWAGYAAPFVRLREFELEDGVPRFVESVRVNLTLGPHCCVLYLRWPHGEAGSREKSLEVLAALAPLEE